MPLSQAQPLGAEDTTFSSSKPSSHTAYLLSGEQLQFIPQNSGQSIYTAAKLPFSLSTSIAMLFFGPCCIFLMFKLEAKKRPKQTKQICLLQMQPYQIVLSFLLLYLFPSSGMVMLWVVNSCPFASIFLFSSVQSNNFQRTVLNNFLISASSMDFP